MLVELSIRNFAIIPTLSVSFQKGLNVLTGETGAGKSIVIDAVSLLIGGRASTDYVRHGEDKAEIEGLFDVDGHPYIASLCAESGIDIEENTLILRRDIYKQGRNVCRVNGKLVTLAILREIGQMLVDIHGQHEHQSLLHEDKYLSLLDEYGKERIADPKQKYKKLYTELKQTGTAIQQLTENEQQVAQRLDLLRFQKQEIAAAELTPGEDTALEQEKKKRSHAQRLFEGMEQSYQALYGDGRALESLAVVMDQLEELARVDESLQPSLEQVRDMYYRLEDMSRDFSDYRDQIEFDPERLNEIEQRLMEIEQLKRKYGNSVKNILEHAARIEDELDGLEHKEERLEELWDEYKEHAAALLEEARRLTEIRTRMAGDLVREIQQELRGLHMDQTEVDIHLQPLAKGSSLHHEGRKQYINQNGLDEVNILMSANPGEPLKSLAKTASGGELSRFMLALKTVFAKIEPVTTMIFDEVDTGVSGRVAGAMAEKLLAISRDQQVLCITHQPQVAALSDQHFRIVKEVQEGSTVTGIIPLNEEDKKQELARMMSGDEITQATENHASELIQSAHSMKQKWQKLSS